MCPVLSRKELLLKAMHYGNHNYAMSFIKVLHAGHSTEMDIWMITLSELIFSP